MLLQRVNVPWFAERGNPDWGSLEPWQFPAGPVSDQCCGHSSNRITVDAEKVLNCLNNKENSLWNMVNSPKRKLTVIWNGMYWRGRVWDCFSTSSCMADCQRWRLINHISRAGHCSWYEEILDFFLTPKVLVVNC